VFLNEQERRELNSFYVSAYRKHFAYGTGLKTREIKPLSYTDAVKLAREELEEFFDNRRKEIAWRNEKRIAQADREHTQRVLAINTDAGKRGLLGSTIVLHQLELARIERQTKIDRADFDKAVALARFENVTEGRVRTQARRLMSDSAATIRLGIQSDVATWNQLHRTRGLTTNAERQRAMDEEVLAEFKRFLLSKSPAVAVSLVENDPLFFQNLSNDYHQRLIQEMRRRNGVN